MRIAFALLAVCLIALLATQSASAQVEWTEQIIANNFGGASSVHSEDVDGDGDMDVLGAAWEDNSIMWWENLDGSGLSWSEHAVDGSFGSPYSVFSEDVDGDGDMDVLGAAYNDNDITWWENLDGTGLNWTEHTVDGGYSGAHSVYAKDVDGDGDIDILGAAAFANEITWWENLDGTGLNWTEHIVDAAFDNAYEVFAEDMDGDGDIDLLGAARDAGDINWWENLDGAGVTWAEHTVDGEFAGAWLVYAEDMDGDGDMDVLGAADDADDISWWENLDGTGLNWVEHTVDGEYNGARGVHAEDVDGDGDMDVLGTAYDADDITWWENLDGTAQNWLEHTLDATFDRARDVYAEDVDGDGDMDILGAARGSDEIRVWLQDGSPDLVEITIIPTSPTDLPAAGGTLAFDAFVNSNLPSPYDVTFWSKVKLPNGNFYPQIQFEIEFTLQPFMEIDGSLTQDVPAFAPEGDYEMWAWIGYSPNGGPSFGDYFSFTKSGVANSAEPVDNWASNGNMVSSEDTDVASIPMSYAMMPIYPNPFNPTTTLSINLPFADMLTVVVYNVTGQRVAELASGSFNAGTHRFTFDATGLASGLYFIRASVPGQFAQTQKVLLVR
jgi:FG-GAP-like repeat/Secretion system C-terminal sorting domain